MYIYIWEYLPWNAVVTLSLKENYLTCQRLGHNFPSPLAWPGSSSRRAKNWLRFLLDMYSLSSPAIKSHVLFSCRTFLGQNLMVVSMAYFQKQEPANFLGWMVLQIETHEDPMKSNKARLGQLCDVLALACFQFDSLGGPLSTITIARRPIPAGFQAGICEGKASFNFQQFLGPNQFDWSGNASLWYFLLGPSSHLSEASDTKSPEGLYSSLWFLMISLALSSKFGSSSHLRQKLSKSTNWSWRWQLTR